jgi:hypothetical protein
MIDPLATPERLVIQLHFGIGRQKDLDTPMMAVNRISYVPGVIGALTRSMMRLPITVVNSSPVSSDSSSVAIENACLFHIDVGMVLLLVV